MAKYTRNPVYTIQQMNAELTKIQQAIADALDREGDDPNYMDATLDMNSNRIINLPEPLSDAEPVRVGDLVSLVAQAAGANFVQEEIPTAGLVQGVRWYKPSVPAIYTYYIEESGQAQWVQEPTEHDPSLLAHNDFNGRNDVGAHDSIYSRNVEGTSDFSGLALDSGTTVKTKGYDSPLDGRGAEYGIYNPADYSGLVDERGNAFTLQNGNVAVLLSERKSRFFESLEDGLNGGSVIVDRDELYNASSTQDPSLVSLSGGEVVGMTDETTTITAKTKSGDWVGFQHNYNEEKRNLSGVTPQIVTGELLPPPVSDASPVESVNLMAHWYNDFGLEYTRVNDGAGGWVGWYTWEWNHTDTALDGPYDPDRHPILGWFRGDDSVVLDWHCYWMREAGLSGVLLQATGLDTSTWSDPEDRDYWLYQLFNNTPNFKGLSYAVGGPSQGLQADVEAAWTGIINDIYLTHGNYQVVDVNGGKYPAIYLHDVATLRTGVFGSDTAFENWLKGFADTFKSAGFDGVFIYGRNATYYTSEANVALYNNRLAPNDVIMVETDYGNFSGSYTSPTVYSDYITGFGSAYDAVKFRHFPNVMTARDSKNHPSGWNTPGSTPKLFRDGLEKAANAAIKNPTIPNIVTIYNVGEWAEAGASLQPSVGNGWGYMDALRQIKLEYSGDGFTTLDKTYTKRVDGATENIKANKPNVDVYSTFSVTLNSAPYLPTIEAGYDKQEVTLTNTADAGSFNVILSDDGTTAGTGLKLKSTSLTIGAGQCATFIYSSKTGMWIEK